MEKKYLCTSLVLLFALVVWTDIQVGWAESAVYGLVYLFMIVTPMIMLVDRESFFVKILQLFSMLALVFALIMLMFFLREDLQLETVTITQKDQLSQLYWVAVAIGGIYALPLLLRYIRAASSKPASV